MRNPAAKGASPAPYRCVVVSTGTTSRLAADVLRALRSMGDVDALLLDDSLAVADPCHLVVFAASTVPVGGRSLKVTSVCHRLL